MSVEDRIKQRELVTLQGIEWLKQRLDEAIKVGVKTGDLTEAIRLKEQINQEMERVGDELLPNRVYRVAVDYSCPLDDLYAAGKYNDYVEKLFVDPPDVSRGKVVLPICLLNFTEFVDRQQALLGMAAQGFRPATIRELLALGAQHPDLQLMYSIQALGTWRTTTYDVERSPYLDKEYMTKRRGVYTWSLDNWGPERCVFAAIPLGR